VFAFTMITDERVNMGRDGSHSSFCKNRRRLFLRGYLYGLLTPDRQLLSLCAHSDSVHAVWYLTTMDYELNHRIILH